MAERTDKPIASDKASQTSVEHEKGIRVEKSTTIMRTPEELYAFWRNFGNLPRIMEHLKSVQVIDSTHSHWIAKAPVGTTVEWDAEIINDVPNERIGWRSLENAQVDNAGSVVFTRQAEGRGTIVEVTLKYDPPAGKLGAVIAKLLGEAPETQIVEDLRHLKQFMETGVATTTEGQSSGREASKTSTTVSK